MISSDNKCSTLQAFQAAISLLTQSFFSKKSIKTFLLYMVFSTIPFQISDKEMNLFSSSFISHFFKRFFKEILQLPGVIFRL
jgi:hypothetical protein